jgi:uncharacterized protein (DUF302 family)
MITTLEVMHHEHSSGRTYEAVVRALYEATGSAEEGVSTLIDGVTSREDFEKTFKAREGASGFMRFMVIDHGDWLSRFYDRPAKRLLAILGNPFVAITMLSTDLRSGLNVPTRIYVFQAGGDLTKVAYDLPSSLMTDLSAETRVAAVKLDAKLVELATEISGVPPSA